MEEHVYIKVIGRVQGVGFRISTHKLALLHHIMGTVSNCEDGSVEIYAQGPSEQLKVFVHKVINGASPYSKVVHSTIDQLPLTNYNRFKIIK